VIAALILVLAQDPELPLEVRWDDGLRFHSPGGEIDAWLGGFVRVHSRTVFDRPDDDAAPLRSVPDGVFLRQARLDTGGTAHRDWAWRVTADFATGVYNQSLGTGPGSQAVALRDAWLEWRRFKACSIRVGQYFVPCSAEELDPARWLEFAERGPGSRLAPGRGMGLEGYGTLGDEGLRWFVMLYQGNELVQDSGRSVPDADDEKGAAAALFWRPWSFLRLGAGGTVADVDDVPAAGFDLVSTELSILYLDSTSGTFDGRRTRLDGGLLAHGGPFSFKAELLSRRDEVAGAEDLRSRGAYVQATWLMTGEEKKPGERTIPAGRWGGLELALRTGRLEVENAYDAGLAVRGAGDAERVTSWSLALSWWLGRRFRLTLNGVREQYSSPLSFDGRTEDVLTGLLVRMQLDF
jgi:phosphate-selective porin